MAISAVGVFAAYTSSTAAPSTSYAVVTSDVSSGQRLAAADVSLVPLELPVEQQEVSYSDLDLLVGATALAPMRAGQLVAASDVARPQGGDGRAQISVSVPPGTALNGAAKYLRPGELVDVIATFIEASVPVTRTVSRSAVVVQVFVGGEAVGGTGAVTVIVAVPEEELEPIAEASAMAKLSIARTTGLLRPSTPPAAAGAETPVPEAPLAPDDAAPSSAGAPPVEDAAASAEAPAPAPAPVPVPVPAEPIASPPGGAAPPASTPSTVGGG